MERGRVSSTRKTDAFCSLKERADRVKSLSELANLSKRMGYSGGNAHSSLRTGNCEGSKENWREGKIRRTATDLVTAISISCLQGLGFYSLGP